MSDGLQRNSPQELEFQSEIARVFQSYEENKEGFEFPMMADNVIGWIIYNLQWRYPTVSKETFVKAIDATWDLVASLSKEPPAENKA